MPRRPAPLPDAVRELAARQAGLVATRQCTAHGMSREQVVARARAKTWEQVVHGVYDTGVPSPVDADPYDRRRRRSACLGLLAHPGSVATGLCALVLHGVQGVPADVVPEVSMPTGAPRAARPPVRLRRLAVERWDDVDGFRCTPAPEALVQALPGLPRLRGVALMDSLRHAGRLEDDVVERLRSSARGRRGLARTHGWWDEIDGRAESPAETWARLSCADAGCAPDAVQLRVADRRGVVFARVDLAWRLPDGGALFVEIDGRDVHSTPAAVFADRTRQNRLDTRRTLVRRFTGADAWHGRVGVEVRRTLLDVGWRPRPVPAGAVYRLD